MKRLLLPFLALLYGVLMFRVVLPADAVVHAGDHNYGLMAFYKSELPGSIFGGFWRSFPLLGRVGHMPPSWSLLALSLLPVDIYMDWIYGINLLLASFFLFAFLRLRKVAPLAAALGALAAFWLGSNLTLVLPGHLDKYGVLVFAAASLLALECFLQRPSARRALLAGGCVGAMFLQQADLALFFALILGAWLLLGLLTRSRMSWRLLPWMALPAVLILWEAYRYNLTAHIRGVEVLERGTAAQRWAFATQWSWPPGESLDLIAPGYWGWASGHEIAPYHGVMGGGEAFPNLKNESQYLGILPVALALLAAVSRLRRARRSDAAEVAFWTAAVVVTFLLACGKYTPIYGLFYRLPLVSSIRNPNKFLQVFQLCLGILAAHGAAELLRDDLPRRFRLGFAIALAVAAAGLGLSSLLTDPADPLQLRAFAGTPWAAHARGILATRRDALLHAALFASVGAVLFYLADGRRRSPVLAAAVAAVAIDGLLLGARYIQPMDTRFIKHNPVADFLVRDLGHHRVALLDRDEVHNLLLTHVFPAHQIPFAEIVAAPRLQSEYYAYFEQLDGREFLRWRDFAVKYVLSTRAAWEQIRVMPGVGERLRPVMTYTAGGEPHLILQLEPPGPRFAFTEPGAGEVLTAEATGRGFNLRVRVDADRGVLRLSDKWDAALFARVDDGPRLPLQPEGLLFASLELPRGEHRVELGFHTPATGRVLQFAGLLLTLVAAVWPACRPIFLRKRIDNTSPLGL